MCIFFTLLFVTCCKIYYFLMTKQHMFCMLVYMFILQLRVVHESTNVWSLAAK